MDTLVKPAAFAWGRALAAYMRWHLDQATITSQTLAPVPAGPVIWACWHTTNLIALTFYPSLLRGRTCQVFVSPGYLGHIMRGTFAGIGGYAVGTLPPDGTGNPKAALKQMSRALQNGHDVVFAVDGPSGPAGRVRPGALWLARLTGCPIVPAAFAARPALRMPRWDRQIIPLPGTHISTVFGEPINVDRRADIEGEPSRVLAAALGDLTRRAWALLDPGAGTADAPSSIEHADNRG